MKFDFFTGVLNWALGFIGQNIGAAVGLTAFGAFGWAIGVWALKKFKPWKPLEEYASQKAYNWGSMERAIVLKKIPNQEAQKIALTESENVSEAIQDAFVRGLRGDPFKNGELS